MDNNGTPTTWTETKAGQNLQKRLTNEHTLNSLDGLLAKIDSLEQAVGNLTTIMQQGPGMVAMVADMADETYRKADASGVHIEERLNNALAIAEKLTAPAMVEKLDGLLKMADQSPGLMAMTVDMVDEGYRKANETGVNIDERISNALVLAEKLTAPVMIEKLDSLLKLADQGPGLMAMVLDMVDESYRNADGKGVRIDERIKSTLALIEKATTPEMLQTVNNIMTFANQAPGLGAMMLDVFDDVMRKSIDKGFDLQALGSIAEASNRALTLASAEPPAKVGGIFGLLKLIKDKDRQKGIGFLMNFLKHLGRNI